MIMFLVPQFTLGGAMIPVPDFISGPTAARWTFESLMAISGAGSDVAADVCWALPKTCGRRWTWKTSRPTAAAAWALTSCARSSCNFPGIGDFL